MSFDVSAEAYGRFMGRYADPLAAPFATYAGVRPGDRALDVGCGPGALTARLVDVVGLGAVAAIDPSPSFVAATGRRFPGIDVRAGVAEPRGRHVRRAARAAARVLRRFAPRSAVPDPCGGVDRPRPGGGAGLTGQPKTCRRRSAFQRDSAYSSATSECTVIPPPVPNT